MPATLLARLARFFADPDADSFDDLALAAFRFQAERISALWSLCAAGGKDPAALATWRDIPLVPVAAWKTVELAAAPAVETFRSSGTLGERSVHHHPFPDLYRQAIDASFPRFCLAGLDRPPMLSLVAPREVLPDSSLSFMVDHLVAHFGDPERSLWGFGPRGVEAAKTRSWTASRQREGRPVLVLTTALALDQWLASLERLALRFRLPAGSAVFETGGFKTRDGEISRDDLLARLELQVGVPAGRVVREYGMTELTSQCYTDALAGGDPDLFVPPHWVRVRILDPATLDEAGAGSVGLISILDLANLGSAIHLLTQDLGVAEGRGFRLVGRATGAELRGCSLAAEELARADSRAARG